jgi:DNA-binding transcriptional ArsR family regulator
VIDFATAKKIAHMLATVGEPSRLRILYRLAHGPHHVGQLADLLGIPMVNMSHHLGVMRQCGIVEDEKEGRRVIYRLRSDITTSGNNPDFLALLSIGHYQLLIRKEQSKPAEKPRTRRKVGPAKKATKRRTTD